MASGRCGASGSESSSTASIQVGTKDWPKGGFWGLAIATRALVTAMYWCLTFCMAELTAALPHAGGFYAFVRSAFGPLGGYLCGMAELAEYILIMGVGVYYVGDLVKIYVAWLPEPIFWVFFTGSFTFLAVRFPETSMRLNLWIAWVAVAMLGVLCLGILLSGKVDVGLWLTVPPMAGVADASPVLPGGGRGILGAMPYAIWFFLALEAMPLAAEEAKDPVRDLPKAMVTAMAMLSGLAIFVLILNPAIPVEVITPEGEVLRGAAALATSSQPFDDGLNVVFGPAGFWRQAAGVGAILASFTGYPACIYAYSRVCFALSRAGYLPPALSVTNAQRVPARAAIVCGVLALGITEAIQLVGGEETDAGLALIVMSVVCAVVTYVLVMASYIQLRRSRPNLPRPYRSPFGLAGAFGGTALATLALVSTFVEPTYRLAVGGMVVFLGLAVAYFFLVSRRQVVEEAIEETDPQEDPPSEAV
ncbi:MAG: amino acid permease [Oscillatoriales cyanobacterium SM2_1_8]|nr:amino acid permease [Oscillatoriales cyanobacterium SM2_1_8]